MLRLLAQIDLARGMALHRLKRLKPCLNSLSQALAVFRQTGSQSELATTYNELAAVDAELGNWRDAFDYRTLAQSLTTQLLRNQLDQRFATLKVEFDTASKEQQNALLMRENAANQAALAQRLKASNLQTAVIVLGAAASGRADDAGRAPATQFTAPAAVGDDRRTDRRAQSARGDWHCCRRCCAGASSQFRS